MKKEVEEKKIAGIKIRKPSFFLYWLPTLIMRIFAYFHWRLRIDNEEIRKLKSPIVAIGPHTSTLDALSVLCGLFPKRFNIVASKDLFTWKQLKPFIERFGAIPFNQLAGDLGGIKRIKAAIEQNRNVLLFPEGRSSLDGKQLYYQSPSTAKLLKFLGATVVLVKSNGCYLTKPRFIKGFRKGRIEVKATVLFTKEEVLTMSVKDLQERIEKNMAFNDNVWQQENGVRFKAKELASNLNYVLYKCPRCGAEYEMRAAGDTLTCDACGNVVKYTAAGHLVAEGDNVSIDRLDKWVDFERDSVFEELKNPDFKLSKEVVAYVRDDATREYVEVGEGELWIDKKEIGYNGVLSGAFSEKKASLSNIITIITKNDEGIDFTFDGTPYRFMFKEKKYSMKYCLTVEAIYAINHNLDIVPKDKTE